MPKQLTTICSPAQTHPESSKPIAVYPFCLTLDSYALSLLPVPKHGSCCKPALVLQLLLLLLHAISHKPRPVCSFPPGQYGSSPYGHGSVCKCRLAVGQNAQAVLQGACVVVDCCHNLVIFCHALLPLSRNSILHRQRQ